MNACCDGCYYGKTCEKNTSTESGGETRTRFNNPQAENENQWKYGTISWYNDLTGDGAITSSDGLRYRFHYSSLKKSFRESIAPPRVLYGIKVKFQLLSFTGAEQFADQVEARCLTNAELRKSMTEGKTPDMSSYWTRRKEH